MSSNIQTKRICKHVINLQIRNILFINNNNVDKKIYLYIKSFLINKNIYYCNKPHKLYEIQLMCRLNIIKFTPSNVKFLAIFRNYPIVEYLLTQNIIPKQKTADYVLSDNNIKMLILLYQYNIKCSDNAIKKYALITDIKYKYNILAFITSN
jgi:hypothetical protein